MQKILIIDDDKDLCFLLNQFLCRKGYEITVSYSGVEAMQYMEEIRPELILCDLKLEDIDGITLLGMIKEIYNDLPVIIITGYSDLKTSTLALKQGAFDYVMKPLLTEQILLTIQEALSSRQQGQTIAANIHMPYKGSPDYFFWSDTDFMRKLFRQVHLVGPTECSVIIYGEDGSGKRSLAHEVHKRSKRSHMPFMILNSRGLVKEQTEEELFGSEKEINEGIIQVKKGILEQANGGTIFIAEAEMLPLAVQDTLVRFIRQKKMRRLGGQADMEFDVRVFIGSNSLLWKATRNGTFREDLYHHLNDFNIIIHPLRERREDIMAFANHFLLLYNETFSKRIKGFTPDATAVLKHYTWQDNVRELKNIIKKAVLLSTGQLIGVECLPVEITRRDAILSDYKPA
ncbi:MAG: sigma-54 dependent transcriptional regulator [Sediminibacterium sp.]